MTDAVIAILAALSGILALLLLVTLPAAWREQKKINKLLRDWRNRND